MSLDPNRPLSQWTNWQMIRQIAALPAAAFLVVVAGMIPPA